MIRFLMILIFLWINCCLFSQDTGRKCFIGISGGAAIPVVDFADNSADNLDAGYAETGYNLNMVNFGYVIWKNLGVTARGFLSAHTTDFSMEATWSYQGVMAGPFGVIPIHEKLDIGLQAMIGYVSAKIEVIDLGETIARNVGYDFGTTLFYGFSKRWYLMASADYFTSKPKFNEGSRRISAINVNLGIAYRIIP
jgi:hypothetical protein